MESTDTHQDDPDKKPEAVALRPTDAEIDEEVRKFIAGEPSKITVKNVEPRPAEEPFELPPGYEWAGGGIAIRKPMTPELQQILDDAKSAGFEVWGDLGDAIFIVKQRAGDEQIIGVGSF